MFVCCSCIVNIAQSNDRQIADSKTTIVENFLIMRDRWLHCFNAQKVTDLVILQYPARDDFGCNEKINAIFQVHLFSIMD
jgi:hypothetical protein